MLAEPSMNHFHSRMVSHVLSSPEVEWKRNAKVNGSRSMDEHDASI